MPKKGENTQPEQTPEQKDLEMRVKLFDKEFQEIQRKYLLKVVAQVIFPGGAVLSVPIQVFPVSGAPAPIEQPSDQASEPD